MINEKELSELMKPFKLVKEGFDGVLLMEILLIYENFQMQYR